MLFDVEKIARLSYLELNDDERKIFETQFSDILKYVDQLNQIPMSSEEAKSMNSFHIQSAFYDMFDLDPNANLRSEPADEEQKSLILSNSEALENAPKSSGLPNELLFEVPSIIER